MANGDAKAPSPPQPQAPSQPVQPNIMDLLKQAKRVQQMGPHSQSGDMQAIASKAINVSELEAKTRQKSHHQQQQQHHHQSSGNKVLQDLFKTADLKPQKRVPTPPLNALTEEQLLAMMAGKDAASGSVADAKMEVKFKVKFIKKWSRRFWSIQINKKQRTYWYFHYFMMLLEIFIHLF